MLIGWFIGGPDGESRRVLATSTGMRSVVVVLYAAKTSLGWSLARRSHAGPLGELADTNYLCMDHPVSTSHLKLDGANESCTSRRFKIPRKKLCP
jgi:hypothetical protein